MRVLVGYSLLLFSFVRVFTSLFRFVGSVRGDGEGSGGVSSEISVLLGFAGLGKVSW